MFNVQTERRLTDLGLRAELVAEVQAQRMSLASAAGPSSASPRERVAVQRAIAATFLGGFRLVALSAAGLGLASAAIAALTIDAQPEARSSDDPARTPPIDLRKRGRAYWSRDGDPERHSTQAGGA